MVLLLWSKRCRKDPWSRIYRGVVYDTSSIERIPDFHCSTWQNVEKTVRAVAEIGPWRNRRRTYLYHPRGRLHPHPHRRTGDIALQCRTGEIKKRNDTKFTTKTRMIYGYNYDTGFQEYGLDNHGHPARSVMTIPGIALFYSGLVDRKMSWTSSCKSAHRRQSAYSGSPFGYSFVFGSSLMETGSVWNISSRWFRQALPARASLLQPDRPDSGTMFVLFQCMFAVIYLPLILGSFLRNRSSLPVSDVYSAFWSILVYIPMAHWVWGGGFLQQMGAIDFAGGTVVHINAGIAAWSWPYW